MEIQALVSGYTEYLFGQVDPRTPANSLEERTFLWDPEAGVPTCIHTCPLHLENGREARKTNPDFSWREGYLDLPWHPQGSPGAESQTS